jgi:hypothetical protein
MSHEPLTLLNSISSVPPLSFHNAFQNRLMLSPLANNTLAPALHARLTATSDTRPGDPADPHEWEEEVGAR